MTPAELLDDHARRPRNLGKLIGASAVGDVGSIIAGDALRFYILLDAGRITQARFQVFNCQGQIAPTSALTELAIGRTPAEARALDHRALAAHLGGLGIDHLPPQLWGAEALRACLDALENRTPRYDEEREALLCRCFGITEQSVRQAIALNDLKTINAVVEATTAGSGCGSCQTDIRRLIDEAARPARESARGQPVAGAGGVQNRIALLRRIEQLVRSDLLGTLHAQGGDLDLWDLDGMTLRVKAKGRLAEDEALRNEQLARLEQLLREKIDPKLGVSLA